MPSEKRFGLNPDQYYDLCREYDKKWEENKHLYVRHEEVTDAPESPIQPATNPSA